MSSEKQLREPEPCSPIPRPIKFRPELSHVIFQYSSETARAPTPSISGRAPPAHALPPRPKHLKRSVLAFLCAHERRPLQARPQVS